MILSISKSRIITGLVLLVILAAALFLGEWPLRILVMLVSAIGLYEFYTMHWPGLTKLPRKALGILLGIGVVLTHDYSPWWTISLLAASFVIPALYFLIDYGMGNDEAKLGSYSTLTLGIAYIPLLLLLALNLSLGEQILVILAGVTTDTLGYFVGLSIGKHKIWPRVSPKKSWEGSAGGLVGCIVLCLVFGLVSLYGGWKDLPKFSLWVWALTGIVLNVAGQLGDFFESALKRTLDVKDSGTILPGHGGVLDRIDSLLFILPAYSLIRFVF